MASLPNMLRTILGGRSDANVRFSDLQRVLVRLGFVERVRGDHFIYSRQGVVEIMNLQALPGGKAKPYQVKQMRQLVLKYRLGL